MNILGHLLLLSTCISATISTKLGIDDQSVELGASERFNSTETRIVKRKKRYLAFPDGSSIGNWSKGFFSEAKKTEHFILQTLSVSRSFFPIDIFPTCEKHPHKRVTGCLDTGWLHHLNLWTWGFDFTITYPLPSDYNVPFKKRSLGFGNAVARRRKDRRLLYKKVERLLDSQGVDGRACMLQTICEAAQVIIPKNQIVDEIMKLVFLMPQLADNSTDVTEPESSKAYDAAHLAGKNNLQCSKVFPGCPMSMFELGFASFMAGILTSWFGKS